MAKQENLNLLIKRWLELSADTDDLDNATAIKQEQETFKRITHNANITKAQLIHCNKTGQPIGQLFEHCNDTHIPNSIAPSWIKTGSKDLQEKLHEQPIALLVFIIEQTCLGGRGLFRHIQSTQKHDVVTCCDIEQSLRVELYETCQGLSPKRIRIMLRWFNELHQFLRYPAMTEQYMRPIGHKIFDGEPETMFDDVFTMIRDVYSAFLGKSVNRFVAQSLLTLDDVAFVTEIERLLRSESNKIRASQAQQQNPNNMITTRKPQSIKQRNENAKQAQFYNDFTNMLEQNKVETITAASIGFRDVRAVPDKPQPVKPKLPNLFDAMRSEGVL